MVPLSRREVLALLGAGAGFGLASAVRSDVGLAASPLQTAASGGKVAFPKDAVIRTLLKDVSPDTLGNAATLFHEHLSFEWARVRGPNARGNLTGPAKDVKPVLEQLEVAATEGVGCIVDAGTTDVGRDVDFLKQIAAQTRVHLVACGGLYMQRTYPADVATKSEDQIADDLVRDARAAGTERSARSERLRMRP